jgi:hypothetical protein
MRNTNLKGGPIGILLTWFILSLLLADISMTKSVADFVRQGGVLSAALILRAIGTEGALKLARFRGYFPLGGERSTHGTQTAYGSVPAGIST